MNIDLKLQFHSSTHRHYPKQNGATSPGCYPEKSEQSARLATNPERNERSRSPPPRLPKEVPWAPRISPLASLGMTGLDATMTYTCWSNMEIHKERWRRAKRQVARAAWGTPLQAQPEGDHSSALPTPLKIDNMKSGFAVSTEGKHGAVLRSGLKCAPPRDFGPSLHDSCARMIADLAIPRKRHSQHQRARAWNRIRIGLPEVRSREAPIDRRHHRQYRLALVA